MEEERAGGGIDAVLVMFSIVPVPSIALGGWVRRWMEEFGSVCLIVFAVSPGLSFWSISYSALSCQLRLYGHVARLPDVDPAHRVLSVRDNP